MMAAVAGTAGVLVLLVLVRLGAVDAVSALQIALSLATLAALGLALLSVRRADGKVLRLDRKVAALRERLEPVPARLDEFKEVRADLARLTAAIDRLEKSVRELEDRSAVGTADVLTSLGEDRIEAMTRNSLHTGLLLEIGSELRERVLPELCRLSDGLAPAPDPDRAPRLEPGTADRGARRG
ncbi:hypothetical protein [Planomonospora parontospora]|uniref:hypothetical protein n=1 Tax=Planomonospora parontospora TaxID=58119 RepID=UPI001670E710|nr:hypothetical protein [Planomonospora parontospora]